ncbi:hypothetical protein H5410_024139 [Solanum commersonii]|uniref:Retrotransposon Copia-like N-terminal domain-containing protein n=1 Tax=Solanum commersonii TaxID=4109 RepID=A0A9J5ZL45_SOLCO|nr:hypothetical protein H5410_024139 [Solanum commersonii]
MSQITDENSSEHTTHFTVINTPPVGLWQLEEMGSYLSFSQEQTDFINGSCPIPSLDSPLLIQWQMCNDMVIAWLLNSLSRDISEGVIYSQTTVKLWDELKARYGQADDTKLFQLQREINNISQGASDITRIFCFSKHRWTKMGTTEVLQENWTSHGRLSWVDWIPAYYKINKQKKKGSQQANVANTTMTAQTRVNEISVDTFSTLVAGQGFSREHCNQLIHMFQTVHESSEGSNSGDNSKANPYSIHHACLVKAFSMGSLVLNSKLVLHDVFYVPDFAHNLLSVNLLVKQIDLDLLFTKNGCILHEPSMRKGPVFGDAAGGLYVLKDDTSTASTVESSPITFFVLVSSFVKNKVESSSLGSIFFFLSLVVKGKYA